MPRSRGSSEVSLSDSSNSVLDTEGLGSSDNASATTDMSDGSIPSYLESTVKCPKYTAPTEELPDYKPTIEYFGLCLHRVELVNPYKLNNSPSWEPVLVEINSTQLIIYELQCDKSLKRLITALYKGFNETATSKAYTTKFQQLKLKLALKPLPKHYELLKDNRLLFEPTTHRDKFIQVTNLLNAIPMARYTLNNSKFGLAPHLDAGMDSTINPLKYDNTIRIRAELHQMLLQFWSFHSMINWFRNLVVAKDLCTNFNSEKTLSKFKMLPSMESVSDLQLFQELTNAKSLVEESHYVNVQDYEFYARKPYSDIEMKLIKSSLPSLQPFDKWTHLVLSNYDQFETVNDNDNLYINYGKLPRNSLHNVSFNENCRLFSIQQEGLVSLTL